MTIVRSEVELGAEQGRVFRWVTDPDRFGDFVAGWVDGKVESPRPTGVGARYRWTGDVGPLRMECTEEVVEWQDGRRVAYQGVMGPGPGVRFTSSMEVTPGADPERTRLSVGIDYHVPPWLGGRAAERLFEPFVKHDVERSLDAVRDRLEPAGQDGLGPSRGEVVKTYRKRARLYDLSTQLYRLMGFPLQRLRRDAADALGLRPGDTVVEVGCGTGANLGLLVERVGPTGRVIGIDLTDAMLEEARQRVRREGWTNVELVQADAATYTFPEGVRGILSTLALTLCPDYDAVIARGARALAPGGRWVIFDLKEPEGAPPWLLSLGLLVTAPFAVRRESAQRHPWESLKRYLPCMSMREVYLGTAYIAVGERTQAAVADAA